MTSTRLPFRIACLLATLALSGLARAGITLTADHPSGVYAPGEKVVWTVTETGDASPTTFDYTVKKDGEVGVASGVIDLTKGAATISATRDDAGVLVANLLVHGNSKPVAAGGAIFAPDKIAPSAPAPADFDAFWQAKLQELAKVPVNPVLTKTEPVENAAGVDYCKVTLDNIRGTRVRGQLAHPSAPGKYPAIITFQYAGVYPLRKDTVVNDAKVGWLAFNISAHDQPIDEPADFYKKLSAGPLKGYTSIGSEDRETSYFLRMFLGCVRAIDYIASRPDWDGRTLLVTGTSQGGLQSFAAAGLSDKVTGLMVNVPAGCDDYAPRAQRAIGWPYWLASWGPKGRDMKKVETTAGYFDGINFAARVHCPALVAYGLIDVTARPTGVAAAFNQLKGPKEAVIMPLSDHHGTGGAQREYHTRSAAWKKAVLAGKPLPPAR